MKIFVDVGSHEGQTIEEVVKPHWAFNRIHAIEPMPGELTILRLKFEDYPMVTIHPFALSIYDGDTMMFGSNARLEASLWPMKNDVDPHVQTQVQCRRASSFFDKFSLDDEVFVNMNCEGAEVLILNDLLTTGVMNRIDHLLVDFDVRKLTGGDAMADDLITKLDNCGVDWTSDYGPGTMTHHEQIAQWLEPRMAVVS